MTLNMATILGTAYVQPDGDERTRPTETLYVTETDRFGIRLADATGRQVLPKSPRLGFNGRRPDVSHQIVCDDDVSDETRQRLIAAGYMRVIERP
jgi:hypothetical protein